MKMKMLKLIGLVGVIVGSLSIFAQAITRDEMKRNPNSREAIVEEGVRLSMVRFQIASDKGDDKEAFDYLLWYCRNCGDVGKEAAKRWDAGVRVSNAKKFAIATRSEDRQHKETRYNGIVSILDQYRGEFGNVASARGWMIELSSD